MAIEKAREKKEDDHKVEMPDPLFSVESIGTETVCATVDVPHERLINVWNADSFVEEELKKQLMDELWKYADIESFENPMSLITRFKACIRVVKK